MSVGDIFKFEKFNLGRMWDQVKEDPERLLYGSADPFSTKVWNGVLGTDDKPIVDQWGGAAPQRYQEAEDAGIDTTSGHNMHRVARLVAALYAGGAAGNAMGGAGGAGEASAGVAETGGGAAGAAGGSASSGSAGGAGASWAKWLKPMGGGMNNAGESYNTASDEQQRLANALMAANWRRQSNQPISATWFDPSESKSSAG